MGTETRNTLMVEFSVIMSAIFDDEIEYIFKECSIWIFVTIWILLFYVLVLSREEVEIVFGQAYSTEFCQPIAVNDFKQNLKCFAINNSPFSLFS